jgi:NitT/TauT family transport system substrate-binding protein
MYAGKLDISYIGPSPTITGYVNSKGEALRCIAGANSGGAVFVVRDGSGIAGASDLAGKKVASPQIGNTQDVALRHYLQQNGLKTKDEGGNVELVSVPNADILTLFKKGELDAAWVPEPWGARLVNEAKGHIMLDERALWPDGAFVTANIIVSTKFLREHPAAVKAILEAHVEATIWINENPDAAKGVINDRLLNLTGKALSDKTLSEAYSRMTVTYDPVKTSLYTYADWAYGLGLLGTEEPNLKYLYDLGTLNQVLAEKGLPAIA